MDVGSITTSMTVVPWSKPRERFHTRWLSGTGGRCPPKEPWSTSGRRDKTSRGGDRKTWERVYLTQTTMAVHAVCQARPDMTASDALAAVELVRRRAAAPGNHQKKVLIADTTV